MARFEFQRRFSIEPVQEELLGTRFRDVLSPATERHVHAQGLEFDTAAGRRAALRMLLPPCIEHAPLSIEDSPSGPDDAHFWQYPAITEKLAWQIHAALPLPEWQASLGVPVHTYLGLPWATWIDKFFNQRSAATQAGRLPDVAEMVFGSRLKGYRALAEHWGLRWGEDVRLHTVCQHIYWERLLPRWVALGITDLHLSHCTEAAVEAGNAAGIQVHSWPLAAANAVNPERRAGLDSGKPLDERRLLASFIGAHMAHYRSDVRLRLAEAFAGAGEDMHVELQGDWHFNPVVYGYQIDGKTESRQQQNNAAMAARHYNEILSDSVFALCPEGAGPNTIRLWEALAAGAIPVVIVEDWIWPPVPPGASLSWEDAILSCRRDEVHQLPGQLRKLRTSQPERLLRMQQCGQELYRAFTRQLCFSL